MRVAAFTFDTLLYEGVSTLVYAGVRDRDGSPVVAKLVRDARRNLTREYRALQRVSGSRIVAALGLFDGSDGPVLVEHRYGAGSLATALRAGRFSVRRALGIALQIAQACDQVHAARFIHRDIKPANLLHDPATDTVTLCDFGSAAELPVNARALPAGDLVGTPAYGSPEHSGRTRGGCDARSDLYSLGVTLYELLTGTVPFPDKDILDVVAAHLSRVPEAPHHRDPAIPPVVGEIVMKLLAKLPDERYQSARGLVADLERCCAEIRPDHQLTGFALGRSDLQRPRFPPRLFGREDELTALAGAFARASAGTPTLAMLSGREGSGRSELVRALLRGTGSDSLLALGGWRADDDRPLAGLGDALGALVDHLVVLDEDHVVQLREQFAARLGQIGQVVVDVVPPLADVFGPQPALAELPAGPARERLRHGFRSLASALGDTAPLVIALRGFEHADPAAIGLIESILDSPGGCRTLVVAIAGESTAFGRLRDRPGAVAIELGPLPLSAMTAWLAAALGCAADEVGEVGELGQVLHVKSAGNPLMFMRLLEHLVETGAIEYRDGGHRWSLDAVRAAPPPPSLGALAAHRIAELDRDVRRALAAIACSEQPVDDAAVAAMLGVAIGDATRHLSALAGECLVIDGGGGFRAAHPVIAETALAQLGSDEVAVLRGRLGLHLLDLGPPGGAAALRVALALDRGRVELADPDRLRAADCFASAAQHAMASAGYDVAATLFAGATTLLAATAAATAEGAWRAHRAQVFRAELGQARALMMLGRHDEADALFQALAARELTPEELGPAYTSWCENHSSMMNRVRAIEIGLAGLERLGIHLPATPRPLQPLAAIRLNQRKLARLTASDHIARPEATDPRARAILQILGVLTISALFSGRMGLYILIGETAIDIVLRHGHVRNLAGFLGMHACFLHAIRGDYAAARRIAEICKALDAARPSPELVARTNLVLQYMVSPWFGSWQESAAELARTVTRGVEVGDLTFSALCASASITMLSLIGTPLDCVVSAVEGWGLLMRADRGIAVYSANIVNVCGKLSRGEPIATADLDRITSVPLTAGSMRNSAMVNLGLALAVIGHDRQVRAWLDEIRATFPSANFAAPHRMTLWLLDGLFAARDARDGAPQRRGDAARMLDALRALRASTGATNNDPAMALLEAELAWVDGDLDRAAGLFGRAARDARARDLSHIAAYAHEARAAMLDAAGLTDEATLFYREAVVAYRRWAHLTKVAQLEQAHPAVRVRQLTSGEDDRGSAPVTRHGNATLGVAQDAATHRAINQQLDLATVLAVSQSISTQLTGSGVVRAVLTGIAQNAGAERVVFVLRGGDGAETVFGELCAGEYRDIAVPLDRYAALPRSVVRAVRRTGRAVAVADAVSDPAHAVDPFVVERRCRSLAAVPVRHKGKLTGIVVLENRIIAGAFTPAVISLTQALVAQAAISLDNASLYDELSSLNHELEARVEDRTRALRAAQEQLLASARKAGMADVAIEVLHSVGNALNSVNVSAQLVQTQLSGSRVATLARATAILDAHRDDLAGFFRDDARGATLAQLLPILGHAMTAEHAAIGDELVRLRSHLDRVVAVVGQLGATAADKGLTMLDAPHVVLGEAMAIVAERDGHDRIAISTEGQALSSARIDKHRALEVLVGLIGNALDALHRAAVTDKQICVRLGEAGGAVVFHVIDNGPAIREDDVTAMFSSAAPAAGGRGASNLHKLANAAAAAGGSLTAHSAGPASGATFTLVLPNRGSARTPQTRAMSAI